MEQHENTGNVINIPNIKEQLVKTLEERAGYFRKLKQGSAYYLQDSTGYEYKAKYRLLEEAVGLINALDLSSSNIQTVKKIAEVITVSFESNDWGWGSNWDDSCHRHGINEIKNNVADCFKRYGLIMKPSSFWQTHNFFDKIYTDGGEKVRSLSEIAKSIESLW